MSTLAFLDGALLWGLGVLAIPTIVHLISKRRARRVKFGPIELLLRSQKRTARSIRLRQLLLLLVRTLLLACAALAVARPVLRAKQAPRPTGAPLVVVAVVDTSASMQAVLDGKSMFTRSQQQALSLLRGEPTDVRTAAVACDDVPRDLAAPSFDRAASVDAVAALKPGYKRSDLVACVSRATALARSVEGAGERRIAVFSDLAANAFPSGGKPAAGEGSGIVVEWVPATKEDPPPNHALTHVDVERTSGRSGDALEVSFDVARFLGPPVDVTADLVVGGKRTARMSLPLEGGKTLKRTFHHALTGDAAPSTGPTDAGLAVVLGDDALALDNRVDLPFQIPPPLSVLVVDGAPQAVPFRDEVFYLESALRDLHGGKGRIAVDVVGADEVKPAAVAGARVVVLANVARLDDAVATALVEHVKAGGGLLLTMGDQVDVDWYDHKLADVLPAPLRGSKGQALLDDASVSEVLSFTRFRDDHPVLRGLVSSEPGGGEELTGLSRVRTQTYMLVEPSADPTREVVMRFSNDAPALVERSVGDGRAMLLATTVDRDWSDLAIRPGYLPLMRQLVLYLGGALDEGGPRIVHVGDARKIRVPRGADTVLVEPPRGQRVKLEVPAGKHDVSFQGTDLPGLYRVYTSAAGGEPRERAEERFSVLIDPAESDLTRASKDVLQSSAPQGAVTRTAGASDDDVQLWPWLLVGAVALILVEALVLRRRSLA